MASMQTDVLATKPLGLTGNFKDQTNNDIPRCRVKTVYCKNGTDAGSVVVREGGSGGTVIMTIETSAASSAGYTIIPIPGEGVLAKAGALHGTIVNTASVTLFYG
jgi:hypothetical protein